MGEHVVRYSLDLVVGKLHMSGFRRSNPLFVWESDLTNPKVQTTGRSMEHGTSSAHQDMVVLSCTRMSPSVTSRLLTHSLLTMSSRPWRAHVGFVCTEFAILCVCQHVP